MSTDTTDLKLRMERVAAEVFAAKVQRSADKDRDPYGLLKFFRNSCWFLALLCASIGGVLSYLYWANKLHVANGVISWLSAGLAIYSLIGAVAIQQTINQRRNAARVDRLENAVNTGAAMLRAEIREAFVTLRVELEAGCARFVEGIDTAAIARLAGQLEAIEASMPALRAAADLPGTVEEAIRKAHASGYVSGVQQRLNGTGGALIPLHKP